MKLRVAVCVGVSALPALVAAPPASAAAKPAPDLTVVGLSHRAVAAAGGTLRVTDVVRNTGRRRASRTRVSYRLSLDKRLDSRDPRLAGTRSVKVLRPRKRSRGRVTLTVPATLAPGVYRLFACADSARRVRERSERNNCRRSAKRLRVTALGSAPGPGAGPPTPPAALAPTATATPTRTPAPGDTTPPNTTITSGPTGSVEATTATFQFTSTEAPAAFECRRDGAAFAACESPRLLTGLTAGAHSFEVRAVDAAGNRDPSPAQRGWTVVEPEPPGGPLDPPADDPAAAAPVLSANEVASFTDSMSFLWTGSDPIQTGVADDALRPATVAVLRGRVLNRMGGGIGGVRVSVLGHPELGRTATRPDGRYDVAVGGGGPVTLRFQRRGYVSAQRQTEAPWQDFAQVADLVMVPYDDQVSEIDLAAIDGFQIARGSAVTDADGTRRATMLFSEGTEAEMVMPDGSTEPLDTLHVRATEYTIGDSGVDAMPAALPPTSGYTYAVELSADEAVDAGATDVRFDKPVVTYVDDFLGFPVGGAVPVGYYDRRTGRWVATPNGTVIKIVGEAAGAAQVDGDGDGDADSGPELAALGITADELEQLAGLYDPGKTLWRVSLSHFTPWDANWPYGPPPDAISPPIAPPTTDDAPRPKKECYGDGSIIGCQSQRLGQALPVAGTPFTLDYWSDHVPGRLANRALEIPLTPASVPASLADVRLEIHVAGRKFQHQFPAAPNQRYSFVWDGIDAYGRPTTGAQPVTIRIGYHYGLVKYDEPKDLAAAFGSIGGGEFEGARGRMDFILWRTTVSEAEAAVGGFDARGVGLGGWTLDAHHLYDPRARTVHMGDGRRISAEPIITSIAGTGQPPTFGGEGDGGPATAARLGYANDVEVAADGSVLVAEITGNNVGRIRRVRPDGVIETYVSGIASPRGIALGPDGSLYVTQTNEGTVLRVAPDRTVSHFAGGGTGGDGSPATSAQLPLPIEVAAAPDGSVYITNGNGVKRVGPDGIVSTVAGGNFGQPLGDGGPATAAQLGFIDGLAVGSAGELYIGHSDNGSGAGNRVRRVDVGGTITTVAGGGPDPDVLGDGLQGTEATIGQPYGMDVGPDGALYFAERRAGVHVVRRVGPDGIITTFAGSSFDSGTSRGDGGPATAADLPAVIGIAAAPDGSLFVAHHWTQNFTGIVRRITRPLPIGDGGVGLVPSPDGRQAFAFDADGRHVRTVDGVTGGTLLTFGYDSAGRLDTVTDANGNATQIEHTGDAPTAIVAPGGQRTELAVDANGWLSSVEDAAGAITGATYRADGLMETFTDARDGIHRFEFDASGLLTRDEAPDGGVTRLAREALARGYRLTRTTEPGLEQVYEVQSRPEGGTIMRSVDAAGATTQLVSRPDGRQTATYPDGAEAETELGPDPQWDFYVPALKSMRVETPDGLTRLTTLTRSATLANPRDPFSFPTLAETVVTNGRTTSHSFNRAARRWTTTTPAGREQAAVVDAQGRLTRAERGPGLTALVIGRDARGRTQSVQEGPRAWTFEYDTLNRLVARVDAEGRRTEFERDPVGRTTLLRSPGGHEYGFGYDAAGNRDSVQMPDGGEHTLAFDPVNRLERFTPAGSTAFQSLDWERDGALEEVTLPSGRTIDYVRDAGGRPTGQTYAGNEASFDYVGDTGRQAQIDWTPSGGGTGQHLAYTWDADLPKSVAATGLAEGRYDYTYDTDLQLSSVKLTDGADEQTTAYTRDADGLVTGLGPYTLTRSGPGATVSAIGDGTLAMTIGRDAHADLDARAQTVDGTAVYDEQLTRDDGGRITRKVETVDGDETTFDYTYDADRRLLRVDRDGAAAETYTYDADGNRTSRKVGAATAVALGYDGQDRLDTRDGADVYDFGQDGFLARRGVETFTYTARGELLETTGGGATVTYGYDGLGRRVSRHQGSDTTEYLYGNPGDAFQVTAVRAPSGELSTYRYDEDGLLFAMERGGARYAIATDQVGTPRVVTDATGAIVKAIDYDSFGVPLSDSAPSFFLPFGFAGGLADPVSGLVRFGRRDYEPQTGRWTARDPVLFDGGQANLYLYAGGDPVGQRDPTGLFCVGGSVYAGFGGGGQVCVTDEGVSLCAEAGFGIGTDAGAELGDLAESGTSIVAKATAKLGPLGVEVGAELDSTGCLSGDAVIKTPIGDISADGYKPPGLGVDIEVDGRDLLLKSGKATIQAKLAAKACGKLTF